MAKNEEGGWCLLPRKGETEGIIEGTRGSCEADEKKQKKEEEEKKKKERRNRALFNSIAKKDSLFKFSRVIQGQSR